MKPRGTIGDGATRVLGALIAADGRCTIRDLAARLDSSPGTVVRHLGTLRAEGLVTWTPKAKGTLHPTCIITRVCSANLVGDNLSGPGAAPTAPAPAGPDRRPDMAGQYPHAAACNEGGPR